MTGAPDAEFRPRLTISEWKCPHYYGIHHKDPDICDDPYREWQGLLLDGRQACCGCSAHAVERRRCFDVPVAEALRYYAKKLRNFERYWARRRKK